MFRGPLTDRILTSLASVGKPVGDAEAPKTGGWQGEPNSEGTNFVPYVVLMPSTGNAQSPSGPIADTTADWILNYNLSSFGVSRKQCEWIADRGRDSIKVLRNTQQALSATNQIYTIQRIDITSIGSIQRVDVVQPAYWGQVDQFTVWVTKGA